MSTSRLRVQRVDDRGDPTILSAVVAL